MSRFYLTISEDYYKSKCELVNNCLFSNRSRIIWLGDLNYRIALSYCSAKALVEMHNWKQLLEKDQVICSARSMVFISILLLYCFIVKVLKYIYFKKATKSELYVATKLE